MVSAISKRVASSLPHQPVSRRADAASRAVRARRAGRARPGRRSGTCTCTTRRRRRRRRAARAARSRRRARDPTAATAPAAWAAAVSRSSRLELASRVVDAREQREREPIAVRHGWPPRGLRCAGWPRPRAGRTTTRSSRRIEAVVPEVRVDGVSVGRERRRIDEDRGATARRPIEAASRRCRLTVSVFAVRDLVRPGPHEPGVDLPDGPIGLEPGAARREPAVDPEAAQRSSSRSTASRAPTGWAPSDIPARYALGRPPRPAGRRNRSRQPASGSAASSARALASPSVVLSVVIASASAPSRVRSHRATPRCRGRLPRRPAGHRNRRRRACWRRSTHGSRSGT